MARWAMLQRGRGPLSAPVPPVRRCAPHRPGSAHARSSCRSATSTSPTVFGGLARHDANRSRAHRPNRSASTSSSSATPTIPTSRAAEQARVERARGAARAEPSGDARARVYYRWRQRAHQAQGRQRRRLLPPLGRRLPLHGGARRRQRDERRLPDDAGAADGSATRAPASSRPRRRRRPRHAACARAAVRRRVYGPLFTAGMQFWQLGESHYWGHNAILRVAAVHATIARWRRCQGTGALVGRDHVARLRRGRADAPRRLEGLARRTTWTAATSSMPPNLLAELQRDRRWCQGNLQNSRLMFEPGLHAVHRTAFLTGVLAYASSPLWLAFLLLSTLAVRAPLRRTTPTYFVEPYQLFPIWPTANLKLMLTLFGLTACAAARAEGAVACWRSSAAARRAASAARRGCCGSALVEFAAFAAARAGAHAVPHPVRARRADRLEARLEVAAARRRVDRLARGRVRGTASHTVLALLWIAAIVVQQRQLRRGGCRRSRSGCCWPCRCRCWGSRVGAGRALRARGLLLTPEVAASRAVLPPRAARCTRRDRRRGASLQATRSSIRRSMRASPRALRARALPARRRRPRPRRGWSSARCAAGPDGADRPATACACCRAERCAGADARARSLAHRAHPAVVARARRQRLARARRRRPRCPRRALVESALTGLSVSGTGRPAPRTHGRRHPDACAASCATAGRSPSSACSADWHRPSYFAAKYMQQHGYRDHPGQPALPTRSSASAATRACATIPEPVDIVDVFRRTDDVLPIARAGDRDRRASACGSRSACSNREAATLAARRRASTSVMDRCVKIEHARLFGGLHWAGVNTRRDLGATRPH